MSSCSQPDAECLLLQIHRCSTDVLAPIGKNLKSCQSESWNTWISTRIQAPGSESQVRGGQLMEKRSLGRLPPQILKNSC